MDKIPIILLAAGSSSRMGQPKQLLSWGKQTLIEFQVEKLLKLGNPVYVVLGSSSDQILPLLSKYRVNVVLN
ncbi:MAG TPA: NTP transferase domain-containing protein, partial [Draconibacterium sp.]|nr:NTP transferase domain-containing protein [Draconibacterium sp.]